jgi:phage regulator Rha-like protein
MATATGKGRCVICGKEKRAVRCEGCSQLFCFDHLPDHRQELSIQLDEIEVNRDLLRQTITEQTTNPKKHSLIKQIDQWEEDSIKIIQQTAKGCRQLVLQHTAKHIDQIEVNLVKLTDGLRQTRQENDFNEIDLRELKQKLTQLAEELDKPSNVSIQQNSASLINKISVVVSSRKCLNYI